MNQKTIHLDRDSFSLNSSGNVDCLIPDPNFQHSYDPDDACYNEWPDYVWAKSKYKIGAQVLLMSCEDVSPNTLRKIKIGEMRAGKCISFYLAFDSPNGAGGNMDSNNLQNHGWRGTTDDNSVEAHGQRKIIKIRELKNGNIAVTVGKDIS